MKNTLNDILNHTQASLYINEIFKNILTCIRYLDMNDVQYQADPLGYIQIYLKIFEQVLMMSLIIFSNISKYHQESRISLMISLTILQYLSI